MPIAGSATATIDVPGDQTDVHLSSGIVLRRTSANGRTLVEATLDPGYAGPGLVVDARDGAHAATGPRDVRLLSDVKTLVTIGDADVRLVTLLDVTIVQGDPSRSTCRCPPDTRSSSVSGASLDHTEIACRIASRSSSRIRRSGGTSSSSAWSVRTPADRSSLRPASRRLPPRGAKQEKSLSRASGRSRSCRLRCRACAEWTCARWIRRSPSAARQALLAAYRYQRTADVPPALTLDVRRFPDAAVLAAVAERGVATTLVTTEGAR